MNKNDREEVTEIAETVMNRNKPVTVNQFAAFTAACFFVGMLALIFLKETEVPRFATMTMLDVGGSLCVYYIIHIIFEN